MIFHTRDFGRIEVDQEQRKAYFYARDWLVDVVLRAEEPVGEFSDLDGRQFEVESDGSEVVLYLVGQGDVRREIGRIGVS